MSDTYVCGACGGTFAKGWTDEEAAAEAGSAFSPAELDDAAIVCDDCWQKMRATMGDLDTRYASEPS